MKGNKEKLCVDLCQSCGCSFAAGGLDEGGKETLGFQHQKHTKGQSGPFVELFVFTEANW